MSEPLQARLRAEAAALDAQIATCEHEFHKSAFGCPYCKRDTRQRDLLREAAAALAGEGSPVSPAQDYVSLLKEAKRRVNASVLYRRFIDGTPLENDIAVWMADFASEQIAPVSPAHNYLEGASNAMRLAAIGTEQARKDWEEYKAASTAGAEQEQDLIIETTNATLLCLKCGNEQPLVSSAPAAGEGYKALASAMRKMLPPELLAEVVAHLDPLTPFVNFLREYDPPLSVVPRRDADTEAER